MAAAALVGGKHVLVDKPMAVNAAEGERMLAAASAHSKQVSVGQQHELVPDFAEADGADCQAHPTAGVCSRDKLPLPSTCVPNLQSVHRLQCTDPLL